MNDLPFPLHSARPGKRQTQGRMTTPLDSLLVALRVPTTSTAHHTAHYTHVTPAKTNCQLLSTVLCFSTVAYILNAFFCHAVIYEWDDVVEVVEGHTMDDSNLEF